MNIMVELMRRYGSYIEKKEKKLEENEKSKKKKSNFLTTKDNKTIIEGIIKA